MTTATYRKLPNGQWGLQLQGPAQPGDEVTVIRKDGTTKVETVGALVSDNLANIGGRDANGKPSEWGRPAPKLHGIMQRLAHLHVDPLKISRKNGESFSWLVWNDLLVGKLEDGRAQMFTGKCKAAGVTPLQVLALVEEFEADPLAAAQKYGKASGRCCVCGHDLTDPKSIDAGIGPVCARRLG